VFEGKGVTNVPQIEYLSGVATPIANRRSLHLLHRWTVTLTLDLEISWTSKEEISLSTK
jgi:hypothetical protein